MAKVLNAFRATTTDALSTVSAAAHTITSGVQSIANYADALEAHSEHFAKTTRASYKLSTEKSNIISRERARMRIAQAQQELLLELKDPELRAIYDSIKFDDELTAPKAVA